MDAGTIATHFKERSVRSITRQLSHAGTKISRTASTGAGSIKRQVKAAKEWWAGAPGSAMTLSVDLHAPRGGRELLFVELSRGDRKLLKQLSKDIESEILRLSGDGGSAPVFDEIEPLMRPRLDATQSELSKDGKAALGRFESKQRLNDLDNELGLRDVEYRLRLFNLSNDCRTAASKVGRQLIG